MALQALRKAASLVESGVAVLRTVRAKKVAENCYMVRVSPLAADEEVLYCPLAPNAPNRVGKLGDEPREETTWIIYRRRIDA